MPINNPGSNLDTTNTVTEICQNNSVQLTANVPFPLLSKNDNRSYAAIVNTSLVQITVILGDSNENKFHKKGIPLFPLGGTFEITSINLYKGKINVISPSDCEISVVECSKK